MPKMMAISGEAMAMGMSNTSGGMIKKADSEKDNRLRIAIAELLLASEVMLLVSINAMMI